MDVVRFIHTADLHLGNFVHYGGSPPSRVEALIQSAVYDAFKNICALAEKNAVDFIVISGDVYDSALRSVKANKFFVEQCQRLNQSGISVYVIAGNHDPVSSGRELFDLPQNVTILNDHTPEIIEHQRDGKTIAIIVGQSYANARESRPLYEKYQVSASAVPVIALLHTQLTLEDTRYIPASQAGLSGISNIDYWALGHVHKQTIFDTEQPWIAYAGTPQGCDFGETGRGGCLLVSFYSKTDAEIVPKPTAPVIIKEELLDITDCSVENLSALEELMMNRLDMVSASMTDERGCLVRWRITGRNAIKTELQKMPEGELIDTLLETLNARYADVCTPFIWNASIFFHLQLPIDFEAIKQQSTIYDKIDQMTQELLTAEISEEWVNSMGTIWETDAEKATKPDKLFLDSDTYHDILRDAEKIMLEALIERREVYDN